MVENDAIQEITKFISESEQEKRKIGDENLTPILEELFPRLQSVLIEAYKDKDKIPEVKEAFKTEGETLLLWVESVIEGICQVIKNGDLKNIQLRQKDDYFNLTGSYAANGVTADIQISKLPFTASRYCGNDRARELHSTLEDDYETEICMISVNRTADGESVKLDATYDLYKKHFFYDAANNLNPRLTCCSWSDSGEINYTIRFSLGQLNHIEREDIQRYSLTREDNWRVPLGEVFSKKTQSVDLYVKNTDKLLEEFKLKEASI